MKTQKLPPSDQRPHENKIELSLKDLDQFFNTIDPSPFHAKDLDHDVEEFIVSWATEHPLHEPLRLIVHLQTPVPGEDAQAVIERAVHNYFAYKVEMTRRELRQLFRLGHRSLLIGLSFLALCTSGAELIIALGIPGAKIVRESLHIAGWVAMWHPMETYLYGWWPLRRQARVFRKLSTIPVEVRCPPGSLSE